MTFQITVQPSGHHYDCDADETVLAAAIRSGIGLPYGCKNGACGSCKGKVVEGTIHHKPHQARALSEQEKLQGMSLFCCAVPDGDVTIEAREVGGSSDYPLRKMPTRVAAIRKAAADVAIVHLQLPANELLAYRAGQYIEFLLKEGQGLGASGYRDHIVVCGWNTTARDLLNELRGDDYKLKVVIIADLEKALAG